MPHLLIVTADFYEDLAEELLQGARAALAAVEDASCEEVRVPGALEIPQAIAYGIGSGQYDGFVALGAVIRGETGHYDIVANESARALMTLAVRHQAPLGNGILTTENYEQAWARAAVDGGNKGAAAAQAALELIEVKRRLSRP